MATDPSTHVAKPEFPAPSAARTANRTFAVGLARAFGGAMFFALPLLMTMEMWSLGFTMRPVRVALFLAAFIPMLVGLSHYAGFEETARWWEDVRDAFVALFVGFATAAAILTLAGIIDADMSAREIVGKVILEAIPGSIGAALALSLLGGSMREEERKRRQATYGGELFLMSAGAIFFAFNIAPTEEIVLVALRMTAWHSLAVGAVSLLMMHAFVYAVEFRGQERLVEGATPWDAFLRFTLVGYAIALLIAAFVLWSFGRYDGAGLGFRASAALALALPASLGAAAARLIL
jgi:putative integral membrane protein (TIGR02587 family)